MLFLNKILSKKTEVAMEKFREEISDSSTKPFVIAGGVAANETIRKNLKEISEKNNFTEEKSPSLSLILLISPTVALYASLKLEVTTITSMGHSFHFR